MPEENQDQTTPGTQQGNDPPAGAQASSETPSEDWKAEAESWKTRAAGWQRTHNEALTQWQATEAELGNTIQTLTGERDQVQQELSTLTATHEQATGNLTAAQTELSTTKAELLKHQLISQEAPELAAYAGFVSHLAPDGTPLDADGIKANIQTLRDIRGQDLEAARKDFREGWVPQANMGERQETHNLDHIEKMLTKTAGVRGKEEEYQKWLQLWQAHPENKK